MSNTASSSNVHALDASRPIRILRTALLAAGLFVSLAVGMAMPSDAEARVRKDDSGLLADSCRELQSEYDTASEELARLGMGGKNAQRRYDLRNRIGRMHDLWDEYCKDTFGSIVYFEAPASSEVGPLTGAVDGGQGAQDQGITGPTSGGVFEPGRRGTGAEKGKGNANPTTAGASRGASTE